MGVVTWSREDLINDSLNRYYSHELTRKTFRNEIMDLADNNLEFIEICDHAGAL